MPAPDEAGEDAEWIDEYPLTVREFDRAMAPWLTVKDRRRFWRALNDAEMLIFRA